jgi:hypothetical protein
MTFTKKGNSLPYFVTRQEQGGDRGCDNVLPGQGLRTLHEKVTDEYGAMAE